VAYTVTDTNGTPGVWLRPLHSPTAKFLAPANAATILFWSPDSRSLAFIADGKLRRIDASGGPILTLCNALDTPPGTWNRDDVIVFSGLRGPLARVPASVGSPVALTELTPGIGERIQITPFFLPDGRHFLYTAGTGGSRSIGIYVGSLDSKKTVPLLSVGSNAAYANGYLLYLRDTTLMAQRFDPDSLKLSGDIIPVATDVQINTSTGTGAFSVSQAGVLVYQTGPSSGTLLVWHDRAGKQLGSLGTQTGNRDVRLSPDGRWASVTLPSNSTQQLDIWLFDVARGLSKRLTFGHSGSMDAVWSPDGRRVAYASRPKKALDIFQRNVSGIGTEELLLEDDADKYPLGFTRDGKFLLYFVPTGAATGHLWLLPMSGDRKPRPFNHTKDSEIPAEVSPDGRWIAYVSDENGRREIYVTSFPDATGKWQVSTTGGDNPRWRNDGKEMFFTASDRFVAVDVETTGAQFDVGVLRPLFNVRVPPPALGTRSTYAVSPDGQRFLINMWDPKAAFAPITVVVNWPEALKK
jgi:WD40 repeat protein